MPRRLALLSLLGLLACGPQQVQRPLDLFIGGLSSQASRLTVLVFPLSLGQTCREVELQTVQSLEAPIRQEWVRGESTERGLSLPSVQEEGLTVVVYAEDEAGAAIQFVCRELTYAALETPDVSIQLSARPR